MNKIFKKIWNQSRGCFVAVSEAMTSACQNSGKTAVILSGLLSLSNVYALTTVNEATELGNLREETKRTLSRYVQRNRKCFLHLEKITAMGTSLSCLGPVL